MPGGLGLACLRTRAVEEARRQRRAAPAIRAHRFKCRHAVTPLLDVKKRQVFRRIRRACGRRFTLNALGVLHSSARRDIR